MMKIGRLVPLVVLLLAVSYIMVPTTVHAASSIIYLPSNYTGENPGVLVSDTGYFAPICNGGLSTPPRPDPRLPGLNLVRAFAGGQTCPRTTESNRFTTEPNYVILIDDTERISDYLTDYLRNQNLTRRVGRNRVVAPGVRTFQLANATVSFLFVGEKAYERVRSNPANWFRTLNSLPSTPFVGAPPRTQSAYMTQCEAEDVPLPPDWKNDPQENRALGWRYRGLLPNRMVLAADTEPPNPPDPNVVVTPITEVWAYSNSKGVCMALPRKTGNDITAINTIELLGIICQSEQTGKACFWDNIRRRSAGPGRPAGQRLRNRLSNDMKISDIQGGPDLRENCTDCHRGKNVFLVPNGGRPLSLSSTPRLDIDPANRYQPLSGTTPRPGWINPAPLRPLQSSSCSRCHEIPALTEDYCRTVLRGVFLNNLMPPPGNGNWFDPPFAGDATFIAEKCRDDYGVAIGVLRRLSP